MRGFEHATILSPSFHGLRKETPDTMTPHLCTKYEEKRAADYVSLLTQARQISN